MFGLGATATIDRLLEYKDKREDTEVLAVPLAMTRHGWTESPALLFLRSRQARPAKVQGSADCSTAPLPTSLMVLPISWLDFKILDAPLGEGPLLLATDVVCRCTHGAAELLRP